MKIYRLCIQLDNGQNFFIDYEDMKEYRNVFTMIRPKIGHNEIYHCPLYLTSIDMSRVIAIYGESYDKEDIEAEKKGWFSCKWN